MWSLDSPYRRQDSGLVDRASPAAGPQEEQVQNTTRSFLRRNDGYVRHTVSIEITKRCDGIPEAPTRHKLLTEPDEIPPNPLNELLRLIHSRRIRAHLNRRRTRGTDLLPPQPTREKPDNRNSPEKGSIVPLVHWMDFLGCPPEEARRLLPPTRYNQPTPRFTQRNVFSAPTGVLSTSVSGDRRVRLWDTRSLAERRALRRFWISGYRPEVGSGERLSLEWPGGGGLCAVYGWGGIKKTPLEHQSSQGSGASFGFTHQRLSAG